MADLVVTPDGIGFKRRNPWGVFLLVIVTLGIYGIVWYYKINNELKNYGVRCDPVVSTLAITLGAILVVPPLVSVYRTADRIRQAQEQGQAAERMIPWLGLLLAVFAGAFAHVYYQSQINKIWDALARDGAQIRPA